MDSKLYYEAHITFEPVFERQYQELKAISEKHNFRIAELLMKKREGDTPERSKYDTFMTGHGKNFEDLQSRMTFVVLKAREAGFTVWRYKIEDTIMDSRTEDVLGILTDPGV